MTKSFNEFKKPCFWTMFGPFSQILRQKCFFQKIWVSCTISYGLLALRQNSEKTNDTIPRKCLDRKTNRRKDEHTQFQDFSGYLQGSNWSDVFADMSFCLKTASFPKAAFKKVTQFFY